MKIFLFLLTLIPLNGIAQSGKMVNAGVQQNAFGLQGINDWMAETKPSGNVVDPNIVTSSYLETDVYQRLLLDSSLYIYYPSNTPLDSNYVRKYFNYDAKGNQIVEYRYSTFNSSNQEAAEKTEYEYDANGKNIRTIDYQYINTQNIPVRKTESEYDLSGNLIKYEKYTYQDVESGQWVNWLKEEYNYEGNNTSYIRYLGDANTDEWVFDMKANFRYDINWKEVLREYFTYLNNSWAGQTKIESYYENKNRIRIVESTWDQTAGEWKNSKKIEYTYDTLGNQTNRINSFWDNTTNQWVAEAKEDRTYASNGKIASISTFRADTASVWTGLKKEEHTYDSKGNTLITQNFYWDLQNKQWANESRFEYNYTTDNQWTSVIQYIWDKQLNQWIPDARHEKSYDANTHKSKKATWSWEAETSQWMIQFKEEYFYSNHIFSDIQTQPETQKVKLFPNPAHEAFTLEINDSSITLCQLFDSNGQLIQIMPVEQGVNIFNISNLRQGLYLVKMKAGEEYLLGK